MPCLRGGSSNGMSCRSLGRMIAVTRRSPSAVRMARSTRCRTWAGAEACSHKRSRNIFEQAGQIDFLLIVAADRGPSLLAGNG